MIMIMVNIYDIKARLSHFVDEVLRGERVVICKRNQPVAELVAITQRRTEPRPIGGGPHRYDVPDAAFAPLPDHELDEWDRSVVYPEQSRPSRIAERPDSPYGGGKRKR